ncbi:MAG: type II toxin-antitoxin system HipA family toxin [Rhodobacteraceae bacterium]|nr:type II toxin-antitoxin system HipA family toxin [Paracoccaceae bacterium]
MGRKRSYTPLNIFIGSRLVGQLVRASTGAVSFAYDQSWLDWEHSFPISLSLPLRADRYIGPPVIAYFDNLLPDNDQIRTRLAGRVGAAGTDAYSLLSIIGRDCIGALQILPVGEQVEKSNTLTGRPMSGSDIETLLGNLTTHPLGLRRDNDFRISVAGAQEKTALLWHEGQWIEPTGTTPTTHIIKPAIGQLPNGMDLTDSVENEYFCLRLLQAFGLPVAHTEIAQFGDIKALVVERFDRIWAKDGRLVRLPQEDCCQALSIPPALKYQSDGGPGIVEISQLLRRSDEPMQDQKAFFKANILFWLMGATDGHAKNFSIALTVGGRFRMTPFYDVVSVQPTLDAHQLNRKDMKLAMRVGDKNHYRVDKITGRHFVQTGLKAGLSKQVIHEVITDITDNAEVAINDALQSLPDGFPVDMATSITNGIIARMPLLAPAFIEDAD